MGNHLLQFGRSKGLVAEANTDDGLDVELRATINVFDFDAIYSNDGIHSADRYLILF